MCHRVSTKCHVHSVCVTGSAVTVMSTLCVRVSTNCHVHSVCVTGSVLSCPLSVCHRVSTNCHVHSVCHSEAASRWVSTSRLLARCWRTGRGLTPVGPPPGPAGTSPWPPGARPGPRAGVSSAASSSSFAPRRQGAGWPERGAAPDTTVTCTPRETVSSSLLCLQLVIMNVSGQ